MMINAAESALFGAAGEFVWLVVFVISIISGIVRYAKQQQQQLPAPVQRPGRRRDEQISRELDQFLQQVNRNKGGEVAAPKEPPQAARPPAPPQRDRGGEPVVSRRPPPKQKQQQPPPTPKRQPEKQSSRRPPGGEIASRQSPVSQDLGQGVRQHLQQHMSERITQEAQQDVGQGVAESVGAHLGTSALTGTALPAKAVKGAGAAKIRALLRSRNQVRQAILVQEILNKPLSKRS